MPRTAARARASHTATVAAVALLLAACTTPTTPDPTPTSPPTTPGSADARAAAASDAVLAEWLDADRPGCSAAVGREGEVVWAAARGVADTATDEQLTTATVFDLGSVSKQLTALAVLLLEQDGELSTDDTVATHLGGLPAWADAVTLDQLLHHTSGLPDYVGLLIRRGTGEADAATQEDALAAVATIEEPTSPPGERFAYSNTGYLLLAEIVEAASGQDFATVLRERVLDGAPLTLGPPDGDATVAVGHDWDAQARKHVPTPSGWRQAGAGFVHGTPSALVRWADHYRTGALGGPEVLEAMTADVVPVTQGGGAEYGAGIAILPDGALTHDGRWANTISFFVVEADRDTALAISCNSPEAAQPELVEDLLELWTDVETG